MRSKDHLSVGSVLESISFVDTESQCVVSDNRFYQLFFLEFAEQPKRLGQPWKWKRKCKKAMLTHLGKFALKTKHTPDCTVHDIMPPGSEGVVAAYKFDANDSVFCIKLSTVAFVPHSICTDASIFVPCDFRLQGRLQIMPAGHCDVFELKSQIESSLFKTHTGLYQKHMQIYLRFAYFLLKSCDQMLARGATMIDIKPENILAVTPSLDNFCFCDLEAIGTPVGDMIVSDRRLATFLSCFTAGQDRKWDIHSTLFACFCTGLDVANHLSVKDRRVSFGWVSFATKFIEFDQTHPVVSQPLPDDGWPDFAMPFHIGLNCIIPGNIDHEWAVNNDQDIAQARKVIHDCLIVFESLAKKYSADLRHL